MKAGTMEGLIGASMNMKMVNTPMRVYKEAERKGNTAAMERAMGYVGEFTQKAHEYKAQAEQELRQEIKEERMEKRREEIKEQKGEWAEQAANNKDTVAISEEGKKLSSKSHMLSAASIKSNAAEAKIYSNAGTFVEAEIPEAKISVSV